MLESEYERQTTNHRKEKIEHVSVEEVLILKSNDNISIWFFLTSAQKFWGWTTQSKENTEIIVELSIWQ